MTFQLAVFVQNQPGKIEALTEILSQGGINLKGISIAGLGDFGIIKLICDKPEAALEILARNHYSVTRREVLMVGIKDEPGSLHVLLKLLADNGINVEDCYGVALHHEKEALIVLEITESGRAEGILSRKGYQFYQAAEINEI